MTVGGHRPSGREADGGVGMVSSLAGLLVFLLFLLVATQVLVGLYATSTVRATLHDAASRAASGGDTSGRGLARAADDAEASLGEMGDRTEISLRVEDADADGVPDVVVGDAVSVPPRFVPRWFGGMIGFEEVTASVRVRVERFR